MTLAALEAILQVVTGTSIKEVILDTDLYFAQERAKQYPFILWNTDGAKFQKDSRSTIIQKYKIITFPAVFIVTSYDPNIQTKLAVWDTLESYFDTYINLMNASGSLEVVGIEKIKGTYLFEGGSPDRELGIIYPEITIKTFC
jgi:hypothetical protein